MRKGVDDTLLATYDRILKSRGYAVAEVLEHRCTACQVMLRPQVLSNIRAAQEVVHCDSCGRMLYYLPEHNVKTAAANATGIAHQAEREWMFVPSMGSNGAFVVFINHKGNATMKAYDAMTGEAIARRVEKNAICQTIFAEEIRDARNLFVDEAKPRRQIQGTVAARGAGRPPASASQAVTARALESASKAAEENIRMKAQTKTSSAPVARVIVNAHAVARLRGGHPWIFKSDIERLDQARSGRAGAGGRPARQALWLRALQFQLADRAPHGRAESGGGGEISRAAALPHPPGNRLSPARGARLRMLSACSSARPTSPPA